ncbi:hypothetical protein M0R04_14525 [Candidatus Dojkabacteria bacterium]|jgi:TRAP-type C4-dicarboxylate transport system permease small subunit|nr:hypothetical protein [Candidatus Dojkabacteria bacterium]
MSRARKILDILNLFSSVVLLALLLIVLYYSLDYWSKIFDIMAYTKTPFNQKMFSVALLIAIVTVIAEWIEGRIKTIILLTRGGKREEATTRRARRLAKEH